MAGATIRRRRFRDSARILEGKVPYRIREEAGRLYASMFGIMEVFRKRRGLTGVNVGSQTGQQLHGKPSTRTFPSYRGLITRLLKGSRIGSRLIARSWMR